jgi:hypothetical protein
LCICGGGREKLRSRCSCGGVESGFDEDEERSEWVGDVGVMGRGGMKSGGFGSEFDEDEECECVEAADEGM